ncbi:MAG TPA: site-specific DNA-methyltransferase [Tissierellaceae bacterium]|nr:site-specific DNA-methyltransferase [Tissierellaceae bacterium]
MDSILDIHSAIKVAEKKANIIIKDSLESNYGLDINPDDKAKWSNSLFYMDNLTAIKELIASGYSGTFDLLYLDPPFFTNLILNKNITIDTPEGNIKFKLPLYSDNWDNNLYEYLEMLTTRLILMRELLSESGTIYVHIDWRVVHYIRLIMDYVFGKERFLNEIIWAYKSGGAGRRSFSKKHDNILVYTKSKNYIFNISKEKSYNRGLKPYRFKNVLEYKDERGWYTLVNSKDVWNIDMVGRTSSERVDYATQKPYKLLEKIILTSSNKGSLIGDFFAGSGTSLIVAEKLQRRWVGSDNSIHSIVQVKKRLEPVGAEYNIFSSKEEKDKNGLKGIKIYNTDSFVEIDLSDIECDLENIIDINQKTNTDKIKYLKENAYLLLDYISICSGLEGDQIVAEVFRQDIKSKIKIPFSNNSLNDICVKSIDIWGKEYSNNYFESKI